MLQHWHSIFSSNTALAFYFCISAHFSTENKGIFVEADTPYIPSLQNLFITRTTFRNIWITILVIISGRREGVCVWIHLLRYVWLQLIFKMLSSSLSTHWLSDGGGSEERDRWRRERKPRLKNQSYSIFKLDCYTQTAMNFNMILYLTFFAT